MMMMMMMMNTQGVNNLPRVVTQLQFDRESNTRPNERKSDSEPAAPLHHSSNNCFDCYYASAAEG